MANIPFLNNAYFSAKVGIGTDSPKSPLQIGPLTGGDGTAQERLRLTGDYTATNSGALLRFTNQHNSGSNPNTGEYNLAGIIGYDYQSDWGGAIGFQTALSTGGGGNLVTRMVINQFGDVGIGVTGPSEKLEVAGNIKIQAALLSNQENTDVDIATETVANVLIADYTAAFYDFVIKKGTNVRSGTVYACHDGTNVEYTETSTNDLGDTSDVTLSVAISGTNMKLLATATSADWSVKSLIRAI